MRGLFMKLEKKKTIIVVGSSKFGASLAGSLSVDGFHVIIIDKENKAFRTLPDNYSGYEVIGDATDIDVLINAGIENAYMVIVATQNDNVNSLVAQISSRIYNVPKVYMRLNDIEKEKIIYGFNIQVICPFKLTIDEFEKLTGFEIKELDNI
jgi:trk system potassium uptake protein